MDHHDLHLLIEKLEPSSKQTLEAAVALAGELNQATCEIAHWFYCILKKSDQINAVFKQHQINKSVMSDSLYRFIQSLHQQTNTIPTFSADIIEWLRDAWMQVAIESKTPRINDVELLVALFNHPKRYQIITHIVPELTQLDTAKLCADLQQIRPKTMTNNNQEPTSSAIKQFTINLNTMAKDEKLSPAVGRDNEIYTLTQVLLRKRQNNPILIGEPGVGKTAIVEGLALNIVNQHVPKALQSITILCLDMGLLLAGASVKGEFEKRLKNLINEIKQAEDDIILFIDEAHTLIGSGNPAGGLDTANLLKPALARGEFRTIAATTFTEYKLHLEKDAALSRRFQSVVVDEPNDDQALQMLRAIKPSLESHHGVYVKDSALETAIKLSRRYIADRFLPDKAISLLDTACARNALQRQAEPKALQKADSQLYYLKRELTAFKQHRCIENDNNREQSLTESIRETKQTIQTIKLEYKKEKLLINKLDKLLKSKKSAKLKQQQFQTRMNELALLHKIHQHIPYCVDERTIEQLITEWTGVPLERLSSDMRTRLDALNKDLNKAVLQQDYATNIIIRNMTQSLLQLQDPNKPLGVFLFCGPSGVGKTHTAQTVANLFFGSSSHFTVLNMSEFKEAHKVSTLFGSPPGYVGYGDGGVLTEAVRRQPYHLVLIDEIEKAHHEIHEVFYQIFDQGKAKDSQGREINFTNTIFILTTNIGSKLLSHNKAGSMSDTLPLLRQQLLNHFKPAFLGRLTTVPFIGLDKTSADNIIKNKLSQLQHRVKQHHKVELTFDDKTVNLIRKQANTDLTGAREFDQLIDKLIIPQITETLLSYKAEILT